MFLAGTTRVGGMKAVIKVLADLGFDPSLLIKDAGLNEGDFSDSEAILPIQVFGKLLAHCVKVTQCDHFGLLVGAEQSLGSLGRVGFIARNSPNVELALRSLSMYFHHHDRSVVLDLRHARDQAVVSYAMLFTMDAQDQWLGNIMCLSLKIMRELCIPTWCPSEVTFAMPRPRDIRPYEKLFRSRLTFDAPETSIIFDPHWLKRPVENAEPELRQLLLRDMEQNDYAIPQNFPLDVRRIVRTHIGMGQCTAKKISRLLGVSVRSLSRKLEENGTSVKLIVEEVRYEMAKQLIRNTDMPLREISEKLDYSEISAFNRAFNRWSGTAPGSWRRNMRACSGTLLGGVPETIAAGSD
jgi:AraC-like DNA-binding protein